MLTCPPTLAAADGSNDLHMIHNEAVNTMNSAGGPEMKLEDLG